MCAAFGPRSSASSLHEHFTGPTLSLSSSFSSCRRGFYHTLWCLECGYEILLMQKQDNKKLNRDKAGNHHGAQIRVSQELEYKVQVKVKALQVLSCDLAPKSNHPF